MNQAVIHTTSLTRRFGSFVAVREVSFQVPRASIFGLLGPNGSGKSTLIRMLCGVLRPSDGQGSVLGIDIRRHPEAIKRRIGYMSQKFSLYADLSVTENLRFYGMIYGLNTARQREREQHVMELTGLGSYADRLAGHLSGGWKQRLALACAVIHEPEMLFLDEPTAGIDPVARRDLWDLLFTLSHQGVTMLVTTHYMDEAERCTHVGYIHLSQLIALGEPADLKALPAVMPAGTRRFEVVCADPPAALARCRKLPAVRDATLFGTALHVLVMETLPPQNLLASIAPDDSAATFRTIGPTLEDVFVLLSRQRAAGGAS
ncbi:MAG TPA: ABC transporter ATP-binding protein [Phycisphaerae bacterium]|nr:ABC transporter ATP-binding protein [Phycisphaerae bacterium]HRY68005.1 ABC transporter ATP-binding protein [Phycisphaerae bacterium]HSA26742.1 ABC transporter ATP-binding protein [Phycisphaerae bacterium]